VKVLDGLPEDAVVASSVRDEWAFHQYAGWLAVSHTLTYGNAL